jgi:F-type H+-transporting ATPase subunit delta
MDTASRSPHQKSFPYRSKSGKHRVPASTTASGVASRYANALFDLALERGGLEQAGADLASLQQAIGESDDLARLLRSPVVSREQHDRACTALAERLGASDTVRNFLGVLARQRRLAALPAIIDEFAGLLAAHRGEETAQVTSAVPLDDAQIAEVRDAVAGYVGRPVKLTAAVDPGLLGGLVLRIGSRMVDASLKTKLHNLELSMRGIR